MDGHTIEAWASPSPDGARSLTEPYSYPGDGTYADLLHWHLFIWGTRPGGSSTEIGSPWKSQDFTNIVASGADDNSARISLSNWTGGGDRPVWATARLIEKALFGTDIAFHEWKIDLRQAWERSRGKANNTRKVGPRSPEAGADTALEGAKGTDKQSYQGAAAQRSVSLVTTRLTEFFSGRSDELAEVENFVEARMQGGERGLLVVTAPAGFGKSALAAQWCKRAKAKPRRRIAEHFCSVSMGEATTGVHNVYANLHRQVAEALDEPVDSSRSLDALVCLLGKSPPDGTELVVWLDGIDEADQGVECFLPQKLGDRVCVIISARADNEATPSYLTPWLDEGIAALHRPALLRLEKLALDEIQALIDLRFAKEDAIVPQGLAAEIFKASEQGHTLFVRVMVEDAAKAAKSGGGAKGHEATNSLQDYAKRELGRLGKLDQWQDLQPLFVLLTIADRLPLSDAALLLGNGRQILPETFPDIFRRWISVVEEPNLQSPPLLAFAHPLLGSVFGRALGYQRVEALKRLCDNAMAIPFLRWPEYALRHLPARLIEAGRHDARYRDTFVALLPDRDFVNARLHNLRDDDLASLMFEDWMRWITREYLDKNYYSLPSREFRYWRNAVREF